MTTTITRVARRATRTNNSCTPTPNNIEPVEGYTFFLFLASHGETIPVSHRAHTHPTLRLFSVISVCSSYDTLHYSLFCLVHTHVMVLQVVVAVCYTCLYMLFVKVS
jgi:hypothetical protein